MPIAPVADVDQQAATAVGARWASVAAALVDAADTVEQATAATAPGWTGASSDRAARACSAVAQRARSLAGCIDEARAGLQAWLPAAVEAVALLHRAEHLEQLAGTASPYGLDLGPLTAEQVQAQRLRTDGQISLDLASGRLNHTLSDLRLGLPHRLLSVGDQLDAALVTVWDNGVAAPAQAGWALTGGLVQDPGAWWRGVSGLPAQLWAQARHPVQTAKDGIAWDAWADGRWGEGGATVALDLVPLGRLTGRARRLTSLEVLPARRDLDFSRHVADPAAPLPLRQSVGQLLVAVDLLAHEHALLGHTIRRHVGVSDEYLWDRLTNGTMLDDGTRSAHPPPAASTFPDLQTAQQAVDAALATSAEQVLAFSTGPWTQMRLTWRGPPQDIVGVVMTKLGSHPRWTHSPTVSVVLRKDQDGRLFVLTAYPDFPSAKEGIVYSRPAGTRRRHPEMSHR